MKHKIEIYEINDAELMLKTRATSDNPHDLIRFVTTELGQATHEEEKAAYLDCVKAKDEQIYNLLSNYNTLLQNYNLREEVLDDKQAEADRYRTELIAAKKELANREEMLDELCQSFNELKGEELAAHD